jgi:hypothetical protein
MKFIAEQIFFGAIIELVSLVLSYIFKDRPRTAISIFAVGTIAAGFVAFSGFLSPEEPEATPTAQASTSTYFYDDFNSNGDFRQDYWSWGKLENEGCSVTQQDGLALFTNNGVNELGILCLVAAEKMLFEEVGSMEANISAKNGATGDFSIGIIEFSQGSFEEGSVNWIFQCGIKQDPNANNVELFFYVNSTYPEGEGEFYSSIPARAEKVYNLRLEILPENDKIICYYDGKNLGEYQDEKISELHRKNILRKLLSFWSANSQATYYMDNAELLPPK